MPHRSTDPDPVSVRRVMTRLIVTQDVVGEVPALRKHWLVGRLRDVIEIGSPTPSTYTIEVAEVIGVKEVR